MPKFTTPLYVTDDERRMLLRLVNEALQSLTYLLSPKAKRMQALADKLEGSKTPSAMTTAHE